MGKLFSFLFFLLIHANLLLSQTYSLVIKEGHVIDPKNNIDAVMDIAIRMAKSCRLLKILMPGRQHR